MFGRESNQSARSGGLLARGRTILSILVRMGQNRLELAATEIQEEYERLWPLLVRTIISFILLSFGLFFASLFFIILFWDGPYRLTAVGVVTLVYLISGALVAAHVYQLWGRRRKLFVTTLAELDKDVQSLQD